MAEEVKITVHVLARIRGIEADKMARLCEIYADTKANTLTDEEAYRTLLGQYLASNTKLKQAEIKELMKSLGLTPANPVDILRIHDGFLVTKLRLRKWNEAVIRDIEAARYVRPNQPDRPNEPE